MSNQKSLSDLQMNISLNKDNSSVEKELTEILNNTELKGELEKKNPLVEFIGKKGAKLKDSRIQYSYTNIQTKWKEFRKEEDKIYLFRITRLIDAKTKGLIKKEFEIHKKNEDLNNISPEFICYYCSKFLNFSVFVVTEYFTLKELLENHKLPSFSNKDSFIIFSKTELLVSCLETIKNLNFENKYYICPFITPYNLLYTESSGKEYFLLSEIYLETNSIEDEIEIELINNDLKEWIVPEFIQNKGKLSFSSNIYCLGKIFFSFDDFFSEKNSEQYLKYNELINNCIKIKKEERPKIEDIQNFINTNNFEETKVEKNNNNLIENDNNYNNYSLSNISSINIEYNQFGSQGKEEVKALQKDLEELYNENYKSNSSSMTDKSKKNKEKEEEIENNKIILKDNKEVVNKVNNKIKNIDNNIRESDNNIINNEQLKDDIKKDNQDINGEFNKNKKIIDFENNKVKSEKSNLSLEKEEDDEDKNYDNIIREKMNDNNQIEIDASIQINFKEINDKKEIVNNINGNKIVEIKNNEKSKLNINNNINDINLNKINNEINKIFDESININNINVENRNKINSSKKENNIDIYSENDSKINKKEESTLSNTKFESKLFTQKNDLRNMQNEKIKNKIIIMEQDYEINFGNKEKIPNDNNKSMKIDEQQKNQEINNSKNDILNENSMKIEKINNLIDENKIKINENKEELNKNEMNEKIVGDEKLMDIVLKENEEYKKLQLEIEKEKKEKERKENERKLKEEKDLKEKRKLKEEELRKKQLYEIEIAKKLKEEELAKKNH